MGEQNLCRVVQPYSTVHVSKVAELIKLPEADVEKKLSQMILDRLLRGTIDQGSGVLELFQTDDKDKTYEAVLETIQNLEKVMTCLYEKSKKVDLFELKFVDIELLCKHYFVDFLTSENFLNVP